jgi:hypothetical protein
MKKMFNLQLFADLETSGTAPAASTEPAAPTQEKPINDKEPAPVATLKKEGDLKYSDADVDKILNQKFAEWQTKKDKEIGEAQKLATMNATEKAEFERDKLQKELDELKRQASLAEMSKTARKMLADEGITISDELLTMFVNTDAENTKAAVDSFSQLFKEAVESAVKDRLRGETPKTGTASAAPMSEFDKKIKKYT